MLNARHGGQTLDAAGRFRVSLIVLLGMLLALLALPGKSAKSRISLRLADSEVAAGRRFALQISPADSALVAQLERLSHRAPTAAEWRRVSACLEHRSWLVVRAAFVVLCAHQKADSPAVCPRLLQRALEESLRSGETEEPPHEQRARVAVMSDVLQRLNPDSESAVGPLLARVFRLAPSGPIRAQALELLARQPPADWEQVIRAALADPSQQVRLVALEFVSRHGFTSLLPIVELLLGDARPAIQARASEVLAQFGRPSSHDDGRSALRAARTLAEQLWSAGFRYRDAVPAADGQNESLDRQTLAQHAEAYLDESADRRAAADDFRGLLLLAAAVRAGHDKLTRRLWEHEVGRTDTDDELRDRAIEALARGRLLDGLHAYARGERSLALAELATIAPLVAAANGSPRVQAHAEHARELSTAIWSAAMVGPESGSHGGDPAAAFAYSVLADLDLSDARHRREAQRRLDSLCGLPPSDPRDGRSANAMAN
jgi:hypothetical protein